MTAGPRYIRASLLLACMAMPLFAGCVTSGAAPEIPEVKPRDNGDAQNRRDQLVGKWLGEMTTDAGDLRLNLIERNDNGTYRTTFRTYQGSEYQQSIEVGLWGVSGPVYFTIMRGWITDDRFVPSNPTRTYYYDSYRILHLDGNAFEYESLESGDRYNNRRVGDDFRFSD